MNQQRARRYFSGREHLHAASRVSRTAGEDAEEAKRAALADGGGEGGRVGGDGHGFFDSNCITPGTEFMAVLQRCLSYFVQERIAHDAAWANITVVLSGSDVPGEGEHKILNFIRRGRMPVAGGETTVLPRDLRHCLYGLDADLVMLGLISHEHYVVLLREMNVRRKWPGQEGPAQGPCATLMRRTGLELCYISLLREYMSAEFGAAEALARAATATSRQVAGAGAGAGAGAEGSTGSGGGAGSVGVVGGSVGPVERGEAWDVERCVSDFVLLAMLVGNDFVPQIPGFEINEDGLDIVLQVRDVTPH